MTLDVVNVIVIVIKKKKNPASAERQLCAGKTGKTGRPERDHRRATGNQIANR